MPRRHRRQRRPNIAVSFARRRRESSASPITSKKSNKKKLTRGSGGEEENGDINEDAFEALFRQLEEDLKNDEAFGGEGEDYDEISEEELAKLEQELAEALEDDEQFGALNSIVGDDEERDEAEGEEDGDCDDDLGENEDVDGVDDEEEQPLKLKNWQMRRFAYALKNGRRKTSIKNLAAELSLDRAVVLDILRNPPPKLVMLSAALPDKPVETILDSVENNTLNLIKWRHRRKLMESPM